MKSVHCIHYVISQYLAAEPVDNSNHKCSMTGNRRISNVRTPYLIRTLYLAFAQKIRELLMFRIRFRGVKTRTWIDPFANSTIFAVCAPVCDSLCNRGVSILQSNGELRKMASPYKSPSFRPWPVRRKLSGKSLFGFCNKSSNEEPEAASTDDSRLKPDSDRLFELFWIQAADQGHTS